MSSQTTNSQRSPAADSSRLFRFFQWNDMHVRDPFTPGRHPGYPDCNEKARWALECALGMHGFERPDMVVSAGDIIDGESSDYAADFAVAQRGLIAPLGVPFLPCLGNHENAQGEGDPRLNAPYDQAVGPRWHNYVYTRAGFTFVVVDSSGGHRAPDEVTRSRTAFLKRALERWGGAGRPVFLVTHVPLVPMRDPAVLASSFGFSSWVNLDPYLLQVVEQHADSVVGVLGGHLHITAVRLVHGVHHITPAGTAGYPSDFASFDVYPDRIHLRMHRPPEHLLGSANPLGNIHGRPRHATDFTDVDHPTHESYLWGNANERELTLPLTGARRPDARAPRELAIYHEASIDHWVQV